ncbi:MAG: hypothetical protein JWL97_4337 [Gemmatimonadales bacterium]|nr:hypothetical protein [Gemmatimonadales bacterium]
MAKHDFTGLRAQAASLGIDIGNPAVSSSALEPRGAAVGPVLGLVQLEAIKAVFERRVMEAVATFPDAMRQRDAIITGYRKMGAELLAKFDVKDVVDIPSRQYAAAHQFLEGVVLAFGHKAGVSA